MKSPPLVEIALVRFFGFLRRIELFRKAIRNLGICYEQGKGVEKDEQKAFELYVDAVEKGNVFYEKIAFKILVCKVAAIRNLAICYESGKGCEKNPEYAFRLFQKSIELGDIYCILKFLIIYIKTPFESKL